MGWGNKFPDLKNDPSYLEPRLTAVEATANSNTSSLADKAKQSDLLLKADKTYVDTVTQSIASGSPKGVYTALSQLQSASPTGNSNIYLVTGNVKEVDTLNITSAPTTAGNALTVTLNGVSTNIVVTSGVKEVSSLTVNAIPTTAGNVTVTLNGVATTIALDPATDTTTDAVATKIRNATYPNGVLTSGSGSIVIFTAASIGVQTDATYSAGSTGATGTMAIPTQGVDADTATSVATKIRSTTFNGWVTSGTGTTITFTAAASGVRTSPTYSAGSTGVTGTMSVTIAGVNVDGNWYYWNGSAWTAGGLYQSSTVLPDGSVTKDQTDFLTSSSNLFDKTAITNSYYLDNGTGNLVSSTDTNWNVSDWIKVLPNTQYAKSGRYRVVFYTASKVFISGLGISDSSKVFTTPSNCGYIRVEIYTTDTAIGTYMVAQNSLPSTYVPYALKFSKNFLFGTGTITEDNTTFLQRTVNLFNYVTAVNGYSVNPGNGLLDTRTDLNYWASDFIPVSQSTQYSRSDALLLAFYDTNKVYISGISATDKLTSFTTPANCAFIRDTIYTPNVDLNKYMIVQGTSVPFPPVPYYQNINTPFSIRYTNTKWGNKKWTSYGDSITAYNRWQPFVITETGMKHTNRGIGGTTIAETGTTAYVDTNGNQCDSSTSGATLILSSLSNSQRINTMIPTDAEVITIMGGTNDYKVNVPLGTIDSTDVSTFYGGYNSLLTQLNSRVPNARLVIMIQPIMHLDNVANTQGKVAEDYRNATRQIADKYGVPVVEIKKNMGVNELNYLTYLPDGIHPGDSGTNIGGKRFAELMIQYFKSIEPIA